MPGKWLTPKRKPPRCKDSAWGSEPRLPFAAPPSNSGEWSGTRPATSCQTGVPIASSTGRDGTQFTSPSFRPCTAPATRESEGADWLWQRTTKNSHMHSRQKGPRRVAPRNAAGLLGGTQLHGRAVPRSGSSKPPADDQEGLRSSHKAWHPMHSHLLQKRDILGQNGYYGVEEGQKRPAKRVNLEPMVRLFHGVVRGSGMGLEEREAMWRKARGPGLRPPYSLVNTAERTVGSSPGLTMEDVDPLERPRIAFARKVDGKRPESHPDILTERPSTSPASLRISKVHYHCKPGPQHYSPGTEVASKTFAEAHHAFCFNRARGEGVPGLAIAMTPRG